MFYLRTRSFHAAHKPAQLPKLLRPLVEAAQQGELAFPAQLAEYRVTDLGRWVLKQAAGYSTGRYTTRRLRDLWEAYGIWQQRHMSA
ncbi:hypothetical protein [Deinococcus ficus]|uniref:Uncharacterized protein n=1 Tax=Deinococcus ficus TaxID=317577 RepID=A0A221SYM6_9DEIO|nr:hypothetical protein [Deinococcus ficus]ASN81749.1 hypothetical protein DFI_12790 [Deinococcus ficus]